MISMYYRHVKKSRSIGCVIPSCKLQGYNLVTYNTGSRNLSFDFFVYCIQSDSFLPMDLWGQRTCTSNPSHKIARCQFTIKVKKKSQSYLCKPKEKIVGRLCEHVPAARSSQISFLTQGVVPFRSIHDVSNWTANFVLKFFQLLTFILGSPFPSVYFCIIFCKWDNSC